MLHRRSAVKLHGTSAAEHQFCDGALHGVVKLAKTLAVYTIKPALSGKQLASAAAKDGIQLRFLAFGGIVPLIPGEFERNLRLAGGGGALIVGAFETDHDALVEFDEFFAARNHLALGKQLNSGQLPWVELFTREFDYKLHLKMYPKNKTKLDSCVPPGDLPHLRKAKTRYIVCNRSKSKRGLELTKRLTSLLAAKSNGIIAKHSKPKR